MLAVSGVTARLTYLVLETLEPRVELWSVRVMRIGVPSTTKATALTAPMSATINRQGCVGLRPPGLVNIVMSTSTRFCPKSADTTAPLPMPASETVTNKVKALENLYCRKHDAQDFQWLFHGSHGERIEIESWL